MDLYQFLKSEDGGKVFTGFISGIRESRNFTKDSSEKILTITAHNPQGPGPDVPLLETTLEELGIEKTSSRYLNKKRHPVVMFLPAGCFIPSEVYDGITGKPIYVQSLALERQHVKQHSRADITEGPLKGFNEYPLEDGTQL